MYGPNEVVKRMLDFFKSSQSLLVARGAFLIGPGGIMGKIIPVMRHFSTLKISFSAPVVHILHIISISEDGIYQLHRDAFYLCLSLMRAGPSLQFATLPYRTRNIHPSAIVACADNYFECQKDVVLISSLLPCWLGN